MWIEFLGLTYFELMPLNLQMQMTKIMKSSFFHVGRYSMKCKVLLLFFFRVSWIALSSRNSDMWVCHSYCSIVVEQFLNTPLVLEYWSEQGVLFFQPDTCKMFGSGIIQTFNASSFHVRTNCPFTLTHFTHDQVDYDITTLRGEDGLLSQMEIIVNKIRTVVQIGGILVEKKRFGCKIILSLGLYTEPSLLSTHIFTNNYSLQSNFQNAAWGHFRCYSYSAKHPPSSHLDAFLMTPVEVYY